ncbi:hypothetical protein CMO94_02715 [Candidatus Woesearchaeota archaeon]|jgi:flagellin-specific chaperone FliS|nr:hypothetical protein [Candidatus Woesearchaeota archaeon]MDP7244193.1 hypothetical protein [Flavobacteriales bacterium]
MELKQALKRLKESKEFKDLSNKNKDIYFSYALIMFDGNEDSQWQLGFYHKSTDKMITFIVDKDEIKMEKEEEIFKKPGIEVKKLDIEKAKIPYDEILKKAEDFQKKKYPKELVSKTIAILQNLEEYGHIWNITFVTHTFNTLNMKINPENGEIVHHNLQSLMDFVQK